MVLRLGMMAGTVDGLFYPEERTGYETREEMQAAHQEVLRQALASYPGANGDPIVALCMALRQSQSIIRGAKARLNSIRSEAL